MSNLTGSFVDTIMAGNCIVWMVYQLHAWTDDERENITS